MKSILRSIRPVTTALLLVGSAAWVVAPAGAEAQDGLCENRHRSSDRERHCEVREFTVEASGALDVDGGMNGGVAVVGTQRQDVSIVAEVWAFARTQERAREIADEIQIDTDGVRVRADGPSQRRRESWGVSWRIEVPVQTDLDIDTQNGGIAIRGVDGRIRFEARNGGVSLVGLAGDVRGNTTNGGLRIDLDGDRWDGEEMDVKTTNGSVVLTLSEDYSAQLETGTVNGSLEFDIPVTVRGRVDRTIRAQLGEGGARVRAVTTNGSVRVRASR